MFYSILFILYLVFAIYLELAGVTFPTKKKLLGLTFLVVALMVGFRSYYVWADSGVYAYSFTTAPSLWDLSFATVPVGYSESGFYLLTTCIKAITSNIHFYFLVISCLSFWLLYKFDKKYCLFPFLAFAIYMARFLAGRNNMQIRAGLAIPLVLLFGTKYVYQKQFYKFLAIIFVGYCLHHSMLIALPLYLANYIKLQKKHIYMGIIVAFGIALLGGATIKSVIESSDFIQDMAKSYVEEGSEKKYSATLANPMIYYQCLFLLLFTFYENKLKGKIKYYYLIRSAYFYSTFLLIILYDYAIIAGRTSTIFATYEMIIVPSLLFVLKGSLKKFYLCFLLVLYSFFFIQNWKPVQLTQIELQQAIQMDK